jgi:hypothetical protein
METGRRAEEGVPAEGPDSNANASRDSAVRVDATPFYRQRRQASSKAAWESPHRMRTFTQRRACGSP